MQTTQTIYKEKTVPFNAFAGAKSRTASISAQAQVVTSASSVAAPGAVITATANAYKIKGVVVADHTLQRVGFGLGSERYEAAGTGVLYKGISPATGIGTAAGTVVPSTGDITIQSWPTGAPSTVVDFRGVQVPPGDSIRTPFLSSQILFRTAAAPIRPGSLSLLGSMADGTTFNVTAGVDGKVNADRVKGRVNYETGLVELYFVNASIASPLDTVDLSDLQIAGVATMPVDHVRTPSVRYNAVSYTYLPLDASILGLDPVRLPQDGRVPVFKAGRVVVIHNTQSLAPQTVSASQTVNCGRTRLARLRVFGNDGIEITSGFVSDLDAGTVTFTSVGSYAQPITIEHRIEDEALCAEAQITGDLRLTRPVTHDYPAGTSYVSSALVAGTLQASAGDAFAQTTWTNEWADVRIGAPIVAAYNQTANPFVVTNAGAIKERWALIFTSNTDFRVVGESIGQILTGSINAVLEPVNPATGVPYFVIQPAGWGGGWAAGNVLRFNTVGANIPFWAVRTVLQSPAAAPGSDRVSLYINGDIDA